MTQSTIMPAFPARAAVALVLLMPAAALSCRTGSTAIFYTLLALSLATYAQYGARHAGGERPPSAAVIACALAAPVASTLLTAWSVRGLPGAEFEKALRFALALPLLWLLGKAPAAWLRHIQWGLIGGACAGAAVILAGAWTGHGRDLMAFGAHYNAVTVANLTLWFGLAVSLTLPWRLTCRPALERAAKISACALALYATAVSQTRSSWMLLPVLAAVLLAGDAPIRARTRIAILAGCAILMLGGALLLYEINPRFALVAQEAGQFFGGGNKDTSFGVRLQLWQAAWAIFRGHPWFGVGPANFQHALLDLESRGLVTRYVVANFGELHNDFLGALARNGIVGLAAILALYFLPAGWFLRRARNADPTVRTAAQLGLFLCTGYAVLSLTEMMFRNMRSVPLYGTLLAALFSLARSGRAAAPRPGRASQGSIVATTTRLGHRMYVDPADFIGRRILQEGIFEKKNLDVIQPVLDRLKPRTILDIGANIGNHALAWARSCERLYAFEPGSRAYALLKRNIEENSLRHVHPLNFGLSDADARLTLYLNTQGNLGASSLHRRAEGGAEETVQLRQGDAYLQEQGIREVDFIKIDVEGHERQAFLGLQSTLRRDRPVVQAEWDANSSQREWISDPAFMRALFPDYDIYAFIKDTSRAYWMARPLGRLRRLRKRVFRLRRRLALTPFDPAAHGREAKDLLLVPREKRHVMADARLLD